MKPNILFILVDSMRADKFFPKQDLQSYKKIIDESVYFEQNISSSDYTVTGIGSIFTASYPVNAGLKGQVFQKLYSEKDNYVEFLKKQGYNAYGTIAESVAELGFSQLFENNDQTYPNSLRLFDGLGDKITNFLKSENLVEPWFYFIHLEDLHLPVSLPSKFDHVKYSERYEIAVTEIHSWISKFLQLIELENCLVVITSDHGDYIPSINDSKDTDGTISKTKSIMKKNMPSDVFDTLSKAKRSLTKKIQETQAKSLYDKRAIQTRTGKNRFLFDEIVRTPLLFSGFGVSSKKNIQQQVRNIDIFPTICDIIGLGEPETKIDGRSLKPLLDNKSLPDLPAYLESTVFATIQKDVVAHLGIRSPKWKYFRKVSNPKENVHLYDLENDPLEENNLSNGNAILIKEMEEEISKIRNNSKQPSMELDSDETKKVRDELRKLGYV